MGDFRFELLPAGLVVSLGIIFLTRRPSSLPLPIAMLRKLGVVYLAIFKKFRCFDADNVPTTGPVILVANHTAVYDPVCLQVACKHRFIRFLEAREYYDQVPLNII